MGDEMETEEVKAREALVKATEATEAYEVVHTAYEAAKALYEAAWGELTATPEWAEVRKRDAEYVVAKIEADAALKASREAKAVCRGYTRRSGGGGEQDAGN